METIDRERIVARFWPKVNKDGPVHPVLGTACWLWAAGLGAGGYGKTTLRHKTLLAHRVAYELERGPIPPGLMLDHLCRVRRCVRPDHLEPVTARENTARSETPGAAMIRTGVCQRGHNVEETGVSINTHGERQCRACKNAKSAEWAALHPERCAENRRAYVAANRARVKAYHREYYLRNRKTSGG